MKVGNLDPDDVNVVSLNGIDGALGAYGAAGGVMDYCVIHVASRVERVLGHRVAAATMIDQVGQRHTDMAKQLGSKRVVAYEIDADSATFDEITTEELVGPFYDWSKGQLIPAWVDGVRNGDPATGLITCGYADAFSAPPYSLRAPIDQVSAWFRAINVGTFGGLEQDLFVCRWSTDWSDYFDPGLEWWGAHCWTVQSSGSHLITAIGASSTD